MIAVPEAFAERRISVSGDPGRRWIAALPETIERMCSAWNLTIEGKAMTGELGLVLPVDRDGESLVLKVSWPDKDSEHEALALTTWNGHGAVRLFAFDEDANAMLLERANHKRSLSSVAVEESVPIAARLLRRLAVSAPLGPPKLADVAAGLAYSMSDEWEQLDQPLPRCVLDVALDHVTSFKASRHDLLVNTDLHYDNVLAGDREPWLAIDPKVIAGDVEYGLAPLLWNLYRRVDTSKLMPLFEILIKESDSDRETAHSWTIVRMVDYWLWAVETGLTEDPKMCKTLLDLLL